MPDYTTFTLVSQAVQQIIDLADIEVKFVPMWSLDQLLHQFSWFVGPAVAPEPKTPSPLLDVATINRMGFQGQAVMVKQGRSQASASSGSSSRHSSPAEAAGIASARTSYRHAPSARSSASAAVVTAAQAAGQAARCPLRMSYAEAARRGMQRQQEAGQASAVVQAIGAESAAQPRRSLGQRVRQSVSRVARRLNCFTPRDREQ